MARPAKLHIDLNALRHNFQRVRALAPTCKIVAMVKSNAYGHGLTTIAQGLPQADAFGVACIEEAILLRQANIEQPIILMEGFFSADELELIAYYNLEIVIHHFGQIEALEHYKVTKAIKVWLKINTGMHRLGFLPVLAEQAYQRLQNCPAVDPLIRFMSHFATADDVANSNTHDQMARFASVTAGWQGQRSLANSAGILAWRNSHHDWVRAGIMLYGISPIRGQSAADFDLKPVMTLTSEIIAIQDLRQGEKVGYRGAWVCPQDCRVGVVAIGYGDGYPWHAQMGTPVLVNEQIVPLVGCVSMDMLMVDLHNHPTIKIGDAVTLWGQGLPIENIAAYAETIPYELVCRITERVKRY